MAGIYIHIPFCHAKCSYCDFYSSPRREWASDYVEALINEIDQRRDFLDQQLIKTIYIGGGTPSSISTDLISRIIRELPSDNIEEFTIEVNPEDIDHDFARWIADSPVDRVSMGIQSLNDMELKAVGRRHTAAEALKAVETLRTIGNVRNLSLDIIYGLPGQTAESWRSTLETTLALHPEHLSAYLLSYEEGTRLTAMLKTGRIKEVSEEEAVERYTLLCETAGRYGYEHYEISNYSLPGNRAVHNSSYWNMTPYIGFGPGAHSYIGNQRSYNPHNLKKYIASKGRDFLVIEEESDTEITNDIIITALRTSEGINLDFLSSSRRQRFISSAASWLTNGDLEWIEEGRRIRINEKSWLISDRILLDLIE